MGIILFSSSKSYVCENAMGDGLTEATGPCNRSSQLGSEILESCLRTVGEHRPKREQYMAYRRISVYSILPYDAASTLSKSGKSSLTIQEPSMLLDTQQHRAKMCILMEGQIREVRHVKSCIQIPIQGRCVRMNVAELRAHCQRWRQTFRV